MDRRPATAEEAKALAHPLRLRILRLCLDEALTNKELADRLGRDPATLLHHVRTLERTGFLAAQAERRGARGARERPYRATGKSWTIDVGDSPTQTVASLEAFRAELSESGEVALMTRVSMRLAPDDLRAFAERLEALVEEFRAKDDAGAEAIGFFAAAHHRGRRGPTAPRA
jgi:DNA-binding transcriptional ArsR family regulator